MFAAAPSCETAFSRVARAVRQTVALEARLAEGSTSRQAQKAELTISERWRSARRKRQVETLVEAVIEAAVKDDDDYNQLIADAAERLADDDEEADFADRPIGELVARICRDLGVTPDWSLFEDDDWAIEEARTRPRGSPFAKGSGAEEASPESPLRTHDPPGASH